MRGKGGEGRWWSAQVSVDGAVTGRFSKNRIKRRARRVRTSARRVVTWGKIGPKSVKVQIVRRVYATGARAGASGGVIRVKVALFGARRLCLGIFQTLTLAATNTQVIPSLLSLLHRGWCLASSLRYRTWLAWSGWSGIAGTGSDPAPLRARKDSVPASV